VVLRSAAVIAVLLAGCEWVFPLGPDDGGARDAAPAPFGPPMRVLALSLGPDEYLADPTLDLGMTQIAFVRVTMNMPGTADIFIATATGNPLAWTAPFMVEMSVAMQDEVNPKLSADGLAMWLAVPGGSPVLRAYARSPGVPNTWMDVTATETDGLTAVPETRPDNVTPDGRRCVVHRGDGTGVQYLVEFERAGAGQPWVEVPGTMDAINATGSAGNGHLTTDALEMVFTLQPTGAAHYDLYRARRAAPGQPFDTPVEISELSTPMYETDPWLSPDQRRIYFARAHGGVPASEWGIYYAER
jgi:hypothetical protein